MQDGSLPAVQTQTNTPPVTASDVLSHTAVLSDKVDSLFNLVKFLETHIQRVEQQQVELHTDLDNFVDWFNEQIDKASNSITPYASRANPQQLPYPQQ